MTVSLIGETESATECRHDLSLMLKKERWRERKTDRQTERERKTD